MVRVSVIVPVYNPGHHIDNCIASLLDQSLPRDEYEAIFVDDGSTDDTPQRLDALAAEHPHVRVEHIPNSGWPGRPRNMGLELARGEYVFFVDNDDWLGREALERLHARAREQDADIVIGKVVGQGKYVPRELFRRSRDGTTLREWTGMLGLLAPHKLFRKALLDEHGIRFPEGRRRLEDHVFVLHAYFHARRISVLTDYACYHWVLHQDEANASYRPFDPRGYYDNVREVLDIVDAHTEPGEFRAKLRSHWYRGKMLGRVGSRNFLGRDPEYRRELYDEVRRLALERFEPEIEDLLAFNMRARSRLLRSGRYEELVALAEFEAALRAEATLRETQRRPGELILQVDAELVGDHAPLAFARAGDGLRWAPPARLRASYADADLDPEPDLKPRIQLLLRGGADSAEYVLPDRTELAWAPAGRDGALLPRLSAEAAIKPARAAGGAPLSPGAWRLWASVQIAGFSALTPVTAPDGEPVTFDVRADGRVVRRRRKAPVPARATMRRRVARRMPWLARLVKRARAAGRAAGVR